MKIKIRNLKNIGIFSLILLSIFISLSFVFAIPNSLTIQGKLTNTAGSAQQGTFNFTFRIYDAATNGNVLWELSNYNITTDANGVYDVILGGINLSFADQYYLGITLMADNESLPRINLTSAPYSFRANTSEALNPNASYFVRNISVSWHATIGNGTSLIEISTQSFNVTTNGSLSLANNITLGGQIIFKFGEVIDNLVDGWLKITGALNITSNLFVSGGANISTFLTVNNTFNVTSAGNVNAAGTLDAANVRIKGSDVQIESNAFKRGNVSEYLGGSDVNASLVKVGNLSVIFSDRNTSISLWNVTGTNIYQREISGNVGIGTATPGQALHVIGSANVSATLNALVVNTTLATQNITISSSAGSVIIRLG